MVLAKQELNYHWIQHPIRQSVIFPVSYPCVMVTLNMKPSHWNPICKFLNTWGDRHPGSPPFPLWVLHISGSASSRKAQVIAFTSSFVAEIRGRDTYLWFNSFLSNETWVSSLDSNRFYFKEQTVLGNSGLLGEYHQGYSWGKLCTLSRKSHHNDSIKIDCSEAT